MANYSYLCCCDRDETYPSLHEPGYDPARRTVACDVGGIPLLWLAMFRPCDLKAAPVGTNDGESGASRAPLAKKPVALSRLKSRPVLDRLFVQYGPLERHAELLSRAVEETPGRYVTIELDEIAALHDQESYQARLLRALTILSKGPAAADRMRPAPLAIRSRRLVADFPGRIEAIKYLRERTSAGLAELRDALAANLDDVAATLAQYEARKSPMERARDRWGNAMRAGREGTGGDEEPWELFADLAQIRPGRTFPDPEAIRSGGTDEEIVALTRLLGAEHLRPVPWF